MTNEPSPRARVAARRRTPLFAFLIGVLVVGAVAAVAYLLWGSRAEAPATPAEAALTDDLNLPAPDASEVSRQVDAALAASPDPAGQPARVAQQEAEREALAPPETSEPRAPEAPPPPLPADTATPTQP